MSVLPRQSQVAPSPGHSPKPVRGLCRMGECWEVGVPFPLRSVEMNQINRLAGDGPGGLRDCICHLRKVPEVMQGCRAVEKGHLALRVLRM